MKYYARFNATDFVIIELPTISDSSREVSFSDLVIDFRGRDEALLPIQYQEVKVIQIDEELNETELFTGYVDSVDYPEFTSDNTPFLITLSLLSPYAYASKRTVTRQINDVAINTAITYILQPLIDDGFSIETNKLSTTRKLSIVLQMETIEKTMNYLANTFDFIWYIDKNKKIYLKDIDSSKDSTPILNITTNNKCFLKSIKPYRTVVDYANKINIKNIYLITNTNLISGRHYFNKGDEYRFDYPFSISVNTCCRATDNIIFFMYDDSSTIEYTITYDAINEAIVYTEDKIGIYGNENDTGKDLLIILDDNDKTKVVGFVWNSSSSGTTTGIYTNTQILPYQVTYVDPIETTNISSKLSTSGVIEKVIDGNGKYFYENELFDYATSLFKKNSSVTNEIKATFKGKNNDATFLDILSKLKITNVIGITLSNFKIDDKFLLTDVKTKYDKETTEVEISGRNFNLNENFNDIFREKLEELNEQIKYNMAVLYCKDSQTVLSKEVYVDGELVSNV